MLSTDHSHLRKYLATLGVAVVAGVISVTALVLRLQSDLLVKESELAQLTPLARETIERRQHFAEVATTALPWFFVLGVLTGLSMTVYGIRGWARRQQVQDAIEDATRDRAQHEVRALTATERAERLDDEASAAAPTDEARAGLRRQIEGLQDLLAEKVTPLFPFTQRSSVVAISPAPIAVDVFARDSADHAHAFELKYAPKAADVGRRVTEAVAPLRQLVAGMTIPVQPYLVVVVPDGERDALEDVWGTPTAATVFTPVRLLVVTESEFAAMSSDELAQRLDISRS